MKKHTIIIKEEKHKEERREEKIFRALHAPEAFFMQKHELDLQKFNPPLKTQLPVNLPPPAP